MRPFILLLLTCLTGIGSRLNAQEAQPLVYLPDELRQNKELLQFPIGRNAAGSTLSAVVHRDSLDCTSDKYHLLLVTAPGEHSGNDPALQILKWFYGTKEAAQAREKFHLSVFPFQQSGKTPSLWKFPPAGEYYQSDSAMAEQYLWRWIGQAGPDLVITVHEKAAQPVGLLLSPAKNAALESLQKLTIGTAADASLTEALSKFSAGNVGLIPAVDLQAPAPLLVETFQKLLSDWQATHSPARKELQRRVLRTPREVAQDLSRFYGRKLDSVVYIPAVAMLSRVRLSELTSDQAQLAQIRKTVQPYVDDLKPTLPEKPTSSHLPGHLIFAELAAATGDPKYINLVLNAADLGFNAAGTPRASMPFHNEMSDSVFMGCPILAAAGRLTGNPKYYKMALTHLRFMQQLCLRKDGLYRHSPLCEAAWGRGNGFPALGLALCLEYIPSYLPEQTEILQAYQQLMYALLPFQDESGMWHQVIDHPESYREMSATCMITYAMAIGVRQGWLKAEDFQPALQKAWPAILQRIGPKGEIVDICTGTGKQQTLEDYFLRTAILGKDDRGGAMALLVATEMMRHSPLSSK